MRSRAAVMSPSVIGQEGAVSAAGAATDASLGTAEMSVRVVRAGEYWARRARLSSGVVGGFDVHVDPARLVIGHVNLPGLAAHLAILDVVLDRTAAGVHSD